MTDILQYTPGQVVTIYQEVLDGYGIRTNDGYIPVVDRVIFPDFSVSPAYPQTMTQFDVGLYHFQFTLPTGAVSVGSYFVDVQYLNPVTSLITTRGIQVIVNAPYGNYGTTIGRQ